MNATGAVVVPVRTLMIALAGVGVLIAVLATALLPGPRDLIQGLTDPRTTASVQGVEQQRAATERAIQRGYTRATSQLGEVRKLTLAIPSSQADQITAKALADLKQIRRDALAVMGSRLGLASPQLDQYVASAEQQLGDNAFADDRPVLLAPDLYTIVARADDLFQRTADAATRELTKAPATSGPAATSSPRASATASPSASPSGR